MGRLPLPLPFPNSGYCGLTNFAVKFPPCDGRSFFQGGSDRRCGVNFPDKVGKLTGWLTVFKVLLTKFYKPLQPPPPKITDEKSAILGYSSLKRSGRRAGETAQNQDVGTQ